MYEKLDKKIEKLECDINILQMQNSKLKEELQMAKGILYLLKTVDKIDSLRIEPNDLLVFSDNGGLELLSQINMRSTYDFIKNEQVYEW